jgi:hypothetical protein
MRDENELTAAQKSVEAALAGLRPAGPVIGPDVLMFNAGRAAGVRQVRRWQAAATTLGVLLVAAVIFPRATPDARVIIVEKPVPAAPGAEPDPGESPALPERGRQSEHTPGALAYLSLRDDVLSNGVDALRSPAPAREDGDRPRSAPERAFEPPPTQRPAGYIKTIEKLLEIGAGS